MSLFRRKKEPVDLEDIKRQLHDYGESLINDMAQTSRARQAAMQADMERRIAQLNPRTREMVERYSSTMLESTRSSMERLNEAAAKQIRKIVEDFEP